MLDNQHNHHHRNNSMRSDGDDTSPRKGVSGVPTKTSGGGGSGPKAAQSPLGGATPGSTPESIVGQHSASGVMGGLMNGVAGAGFVGFVDF